MDCRLGVIGFSGFCEFSGEDWAEMDKEGAWVFFKGEVEIWRGGQLGRGGVGILRLGGGGEGAKRSLGWRFWMALGGLWFGWVRRFSICFLRSSFSVVRSIRNSFSFAEIRS